MVCFNDDDDDDDDKQSCVHKAGRQRASAIWDADRALSWARLWNMAPMTAQCSLKPLIHGTQVHYLPKPYRPCHP